MSTTTNMPSFSLSSHIPFTLFKQDLNQYSIQALNDENKIFLWHQFMMDVLLDIPRSLTSNEDLIEVIKGLANKDNGTDGFELKKSDIEDFLKNYKPEDGITWYTRDSFLYRAFNKACRMLNSDEIIAFHPIIKDITNHLKELHKRQKQDKTLKFPMTVYRGQATFGSKEIERIRSNVGGFISTNTFLSTSLYLGVAQLYIAGADKDKAVVFEITINDSIKTRRFETFASIRNYSRFPDEEEILFGLSSVFKIVSVKQDTLCLYVQLELTSFEDDKAFQKFNEEIFFFLHQVSNKQLQFIIFEKLLTTASIYEAKPFTEFIKYFLIDLTQNFVTSFSKKQGRMKELIDVERILHASMGNSNASPSRFNERSIYLLFDLLNKFLYQNKLKTEERIFSNEICGDYVMRFGGLLLMTGHYDKAMYYFQMLLKCDQLDDKLKAHLHATIGSIHVLKRQNELASKSLSKAMGHFQSTTTENTPSWIVAGLASLNSFLDYPEQNFDVLNQFLKSENLDNDIHEKLRLLHLGQVYSEQQKFVEALNYWEEAVEITSYIPTSLMDMFNGTIYVQMAAACCRLNNLTNALSFMEKAKPCLELYYPSNHRLSAIFFFLYGHYLMQNDKPSEAIPNFKKALENPFLSNDKEFLGLLHTVLIMAYICTGDLTCAEEYCFKAKQYISSENVSSMIPQILSIIPELKIMVQFQNLSFVSQFMRAGLKLGQELAMSQNRTCIITEQSIDENACTIDELINFADHYRHQQDFTNAEVYYNKVLDRLTEKDSKHIWSIYRKMMRMNNNDQYNEYFTMFYSRYDDDNPEHYQIISTVQIILYKILLSQNEFENAFNCLINGVFMKIKFIYHQTNAIDSNYATNLFSQFINQEDIIKVIRILQLITEIYFTEWTEFIKNFLSTYFDSNDLYTDLSKIIHCEQIDSILNGIQSQSFSMFLQTLLKLFRHSVPQPEQRTTLLKQQILRFLEKYNDKNAPLFYVMKTFESLITDNTKAFLENLELLRLNTISFENYKKLQDKLSAFFDALEENRLYSCLENLERNFIFQ